MALKQLLFVFITIVLKTHFIRSDDFCQTLSPDAITQIINGTVVVFKGQSVWLINEQQKELYGPCPITSVYEGMDGPIDAALTLYSHDSVTEFVGSSIYFGKGSFYTFKNLRQYEVEWGGLLYLPVKGEQISIGATVEESKKLMAQTISAAYFDPTDGHSKLVFADGSVLSYSFELGTVFDRPNISTLSKELLVYGVTTLPRTISAALTINTNKRSELYLFEDNHFCLIYLNRNKTNQNCTLKPNEEIFDCNSLLPKSGFCETSANGLNSGVNQRVPEESISEPTDEETSIGLTAEKRSMNGKVNETNSKPNNSGNTLLSAYILSNVLFIIQCFY